MRLTCPTVVLLFAASLVGLLPGAARAQEPAQMLQGMLGPRFNVFREKVQDELKLTDAQRNKLDERRDATLQEMQQTFEKAQDLKPEDRPKSIGEYRQKADQKLEAFLKETLKEDQLKRLRQLIFQQEGLVAVIGHPDVAKELNITDDQRKQFMTVMQDVHKKVEPLLKQAQEGGNPQEIGPKIMKLRKEQEGTLEAVLSDAQKKQWKEMLGKPFELGD
jgi:Spy/CpxP family protein refolding chaperone